MTDTLRYWLWRINPLCWLTQIAFWWVKRRMQRDAGWAWSWHCNLAMTFADHGVPAAICNHAAAAFMRAAFDIDTSEFKEFKAVMGYLESPDD